MFQRGKRNETVTGPWHFADADGWMSAPTRLGQPLAGTTARPGAVVSMGGGCSERCERPALPSLVTQIPAGDGPKAAGAAAGPGSPSGEGGGGGDGEQDRQHCSQAGSRQEVGSAGRGWAQGRIGPRQSYFCHEKENSAFAPWIIYMYVFPPAVTGE